MLNNHDFSRFYIPAKGKSFYGDLFLIFRNVSNWNDELSNFIPI